MASRDIEKGEELLWDYNAPPQGQDWLKKRPVSVICWNRSIYSSYISLQMFFPSYFSHHTETPKTTAEQSEVSSVG